MSDPFDVGALRSALEAAAVSSDAAPMAAYMKQRFEFLGVKTPARRKASRSTIRASKSSPADDVVALAHELRAQPEREFHYVAGDLLRANAPRLRAGHIVDLRTFIVTDAWWDTVDALASPTLGDIVRTHPELADVMDAWLDDPDMWLARASILHQLRFGESTDADRLFAACRRRGADTDFFIRKAIGWALRQCARSSPDEVRDFVGEHRDELSPLSIREATKHLSDLPALP